MKDDESENLTPHFEACWKLINEGRDNMEGGVLVQCDTGKSASAAILIGFYAWKLKVSLKSAYEIIKDRKKDIRPNNAFVKQLKLYFEAATPKADEELNDKKSQKEEEQEKKEAKEEEEEEDEEEETNISITESILPSLTQQNQVIDSKEESNIENEKTEITGFNKHSEDLNPNKLEQVNEMEAKEEETTSSISNNNNIAYSIKSRSGIYYVCRKCRTVLFSEENIVPHDQSSGQSSFDWKKRNNSQYSLSLQSESEM